MPSIAQQDYIYIPILEGGELPEEIPQEIQNQLVKIAEAGNALDVVFLESTGNRNAQSRCIYFNHQRSGANFSFFDVANAEIVTFNCNYREITNEPDAQEENPNDAQ